jgi:hypothetical protein
VPDGLVGTGDGAVVGTFVGTVGLAVGVGAVVGTFVVVVGLVGGVVCATLVMGLSWLCAMMPVMAAPAAIAASAKLAAMPL